MRDSSNRPANVNRIYVPQPPSAAGLGCVALLYLILTNQLRNQGHAPEGANPFPPLFLSPPQGILCRPLVTPPSRAATAPSQRPHLAHGDSRAPAWHGSPTGAALERGVAQLWLVLDTRCRTEYGRFVRGEPGENASGKAVWRMLRVWMSNLGIWRWSIRQRCQ